MNASSHKVALAPKTGYLPSLDGWRALAVLSVVMAHDLPWVLFGHSNAAWKGQGGHGVELFFAISGFLITTRILEEERIVGHFDIRRFYIRRIFRIQPAAWAYLAAIGLLMVCGLITPNWRYWFGGLLLYQNYLFHGANGSIIVGHFWSLAVEEHFYVLLSLTLLWVKRRRLLALGLMFAVSVIPLTFSFFSRHGWIHPSATPQATQWQLHFLLWAALLAVLAQRSKVRAAIDTWLRPWVAFTMTVAIMVARNIAWQIHGHVAVAPLRNIGAEIDYAPYWFFALWVIATTLHPRSLTTRFLELPPLRFLGKISYSLYLWHVVFFHMGDIATQRGQALHFVWERPERYVFAFAAATASYYFIEKPFIRKGHQLAPPATPGRVEFADLPVEKPDANHVDQTA